MGHLQSTPSNEPHPACATHRHIAGLVNELGEVGHQLPQVQGVQGGQHVENAVQHMQRAQQLLGAPTLPVLAQPCCACSHRQQERMPCASYTAAVLGIAKSAHPVKAHERVGGQAEMERHCPVPLRRTMPTLRCAPTHLQAP